MPVKSSKKWLSSQAKYLMEKTETNDPEVAMRELVADLLEEAGQKSIPINLPLVASFRGIIGIKSESILGTAMLVPTEHGLQILVNSSDPKSRQNFSIAHEICHTFFPGNINEGEDHFIGQFLIRLEEEYLCDIGASELLIPPAVISAKINEHGCCLEGILSLANEAECSIEAMSISWVQTSEWPCAIVFFEEKLKPSQFKNRNQIVFPGMEDMQPRPELRITHAYVSKCFPFFLPKDKSVHREGIISRCLEELRSAGLDTLDLKGGKISIYAESIFAPYRKDGEMTKRVVSLIRPI